MDDRYYKLFAADGTELKNFGKCMVLKTVTKAAKKKMEELKLSEAYVEVRDMMGELLETINLNVKYNNNNNGKISYYGDYFEH